MNHVHGTRASTSSIPIISPESPVLPSSPLLSTSIIKQRKGSTSTQRRRLSTSSTKARGLELSVSLPNGRKSFAMSIYGDDFIDEDDPEFGEVIKTGKKQDRSALIFECEKCNKAYKNSNSLIKHRWEHTSHWQEASKLSLSKHAQVQLLEASAVLFAGSSLPEERSYWPAAFSPPQSGLLGADSLNFALLTSPRMSSSLSLRSLPDIDEPVNETSPSEISSPSPSPKDEIDEDDNLDGDGDLELELGDEDDNMFDIEISSPEEDSGYGSVQKVPMTMSAPAMESSGLSKGMDALGLTNGELDLGRPCISYGSQERTRLI